MRVKDALNSIVAYAVKLSCIFYKRNAILFFPHFNCKVDGYDVVNSSSDNVLCLLDKCLNDSRLSATPLYVVYYDSESCDRYYQYCHTHGRSSGISFIWRRDRIKLLRAFFRSSIILTDYAHQVFPYKFKQQKVICLNYFSPFKDDYWYIKKDGVKSEESLLCRNNRNIYTLVTTSDLCSRIMSHDVPLSLSKCKELGFPRNDRFYEPDDKIRGYLRELTDLEFDKIICYTPTYRDYECEDFYLSDKSLCVTKNVIGTNNLNDIRELDRLLDEVNALFIYKFHPLQEVSVVVENNCKRILSYANLFKNSNYSLYDLLPVSDVLVTDYTSTSFDFLHADRPVIYYFYDFDKYVQNRGFSFSPIENMCAGPIVKTVDELINALKAAVSGEDAYNEKRQTVHSMINTCHDGNSCNRIIEYILNEL